MIHFLRRPILIGLLVSLLVSCSSNKEENQQMLTAAQMECVTLNQICDDLLDGLMKSYLLENNADARLSVAVIQEISKRLYPLSEAMGLDCIHYGENGKPVLTENENGERSPVKTLPKEVKLAYTGSSLSNRKLSEMIEVSRKEVLSLNASINAALSELEYISITQPDNYSNELRQAKYLLLYLHEPIIRVNEALGIDCDTESDGKTFNIEFDEEGKTRGYQPVKMMEGDKEVYKKLPYELRLKK